MMRLRGEFIRGDGLVIPNNITVFGSTTILQAALRRAAVTMWVALANCVPDPLLDLNQIGEPTLGTNGYARQPVTQDANGWPGAGIINGESYCETDYVTWTAINGPFDKAVNRLCLCAGDITATQGKFVMAVSGSMPGDITIAVDTALADRKFKYRVYLR